MQELDVLALEELVGCGGGDGVVFGGGDDRSGVMDGGSVGRDGDVLALPLDHGQARTTGLLALHDHVLGVAVLTSFFDAQSFKFDFSTGFSCP